MIQGRSNPIFEDIKMTLSGRYEIFEIIEGAG